MAIARMAGVASSVSPMRATLMKRNEGADIQAPAPQCKASPMIRGSMLDTGPDSGDDGPSEQGPIGDRRVERNACQAVTVGAWRPLAVEAAIRGYVGPAGGIEHPRDAREFDRIAVQRAAKMGVEKGAFFRSICAVVNENPLHSSCREQPP